MQDLPYIRELSFTENKFKNLYYYSVEEDLKSIENKIERDFDPLHKHQYFKDIIMLKNQKNFKSSTEFVKASNNRTHETTFWYFGLKYIYDTLQRMCSRSKI